MSTEFTPNVTETAIVPMSQKINFTRLVSDAAGTFGLEVTVNRCFLTDGSAGYQIAIYGEPEYVSGYAKMIKAGDFNI